ncbi:MAG: hypothetical protein ABIV47_01375 [Roseiflexaceae bacterium]
MIQAEELKPARALFDQIARDLAVKHTDVTTGQIFGKACIKIHGKAFAAFFQGDIALKLAGDDHRAALVLDGARLWDPSGKHRPMKEWVQIPFACVHAWPDLAAQALHYVEQ